MSTNQTTGQFLSLMEIEQAESRFKNLMGQLPFSLSGWNPSEFYRNICMPAKFSFPERTELVNYIYYYDLSADTVKSLCKKMFDNEFLNISVTNSGTSSISLVTSVLSSIGLKRILTVNPTYFSLFYNCTQKQLVCTELDILRTETGYQLPQRAILDNLNDNDVLWLTNPVYNTSVYLQEQDILFLQEQVLPRKYVVADECFCKNGLELGRRLGQNKHFIGIYAPTKSLLVNGAKFSVILVPPELKSCFCRWSDVVCGGLAASTLQAISYFMSPEADLLKRHLDDVHAETLKKVSRILSQYDDVLVDNASNGHIIMCYVPKLSAHYLYSAEDFFLFQTQTGASIIPGVYFRFSAQAGFMFRINLSRYEPHLFESALDRTLSWLKRTNVLGKHPNV